MEQFLTWEIMLDYVTFVGIVFSIVAFTKELPVINKIPTQYWSFFVAFTLLILINIHNATFILFDLVLYAINSLMISLTAGKLSDINKTKSYEIVEEVKEPIGFKVGDENDTTK